MKSRAYIATFESEGGRFLSIEVEIEEEIINFYNKLYVRDEYTRFVIEGPNWAPIDEQCHVKIEIPFSEAEILEAIKSFECQKSP